ncbi:MAG: hypothetical protein Ta2F_03410 [Termitinemataceae bacterium]|nr:MAG: hypothetical protein Ta2F_03410 [Termitinemataceae bacterium]
MRLTHCNLCNIFLLIFLILLSGCANSINKIIPYTEGMPQLFTKDLEIIVEYQNQTAGGQIPAWVKEYYSGGVRELEKHTTYRDYYCFVAEQSSSSLNVLFQWQRNFKILQDFPLLVFMRVYDRLIKDLPENNGDVYGLFFEEILSKTAATFWPEAKQEEACWVRVRNLNTNTETYKLLILCAIEKASFTKEYTAIMSGIETNKKTYTKSQITAVNRIRYDFWNSF